MWTLVARAKGRRAAVPDEPELPADLAHLTDEEQLALLGPTPNDAPSDLPQPPQRADWRPDPDDVVEGI